MLFQELFEVCSDAHNTTLECIDARLDDLAVRGTCLFVKLLSGCLDVFLLKLYLSQSVLYLDVKLRDLILARGEQ